MLSVLWSFFAKGGWKILLMVGLAAGSFFLGKYILDEFAKSAVTQERLANAQEQIQADLQQSIADAARIKHQNDELLAYVEGMRVNVATIGTIRSQLTELSGTITPDVDPAVFETGLQTIINNQYNCLERVSQGETNATCA